MNENRVPASRQPEGPEYPPDICPVCVKLVTACRKKGLTPSPYILCAYGHRLADFPRNCRAPEELPVWAWTTGQA